MAATANDLFVFAGQGEIGFRMIVIGVTTPTGGVHRFKFDGLD